MAVSADNADIDAKNTNDFTTESDAEDKNGTGTVGLSVTVTIGDYSSRPRRTWPEGHDHRQHDGGRRVDQWDRQDLRIGRHRGQKAGRQLLRPGRPAGDAEQDPVRQGHRRQKCGGPEPHPRPNDPSSNEGTGVAITAAVVVVAGDNQASADLDPNSTVSAGGNVSVTSKAYDTIQASADGTAGDATKASVGGAVIVGNYPNQATSYVGSSATVDAAGTLLVNADAEILPQVANMFDTGFDTSATGISFTGQRWTFPRYSTPARPSFRGARTPGTRSRPSWRRPSPRRATFYVHSGGTTSSGGTIGIAGGVTTPPSTTSTARVHRLRRTDQHQERDEFKPGRHRPRRGRRGHHRPGGHDRQRSNIPSFGQSSEGDAGVGGSFNLADYTNVADAYIGDSAKVNSGGDVSVTTNAEDLIVAVAQAGGKAQKVGVDGAFDFLDVNSTSQAYVGGTAKVDADGDVDIDAQTTMWVINVAGGIAQANNVGVGVGVGVTTVEDTTTAFIGDPGGGSGSGGTVTAGGNLDVQADSTQNVWTLTLAPPRPAEGEEAAAEGRAPQPPTTAAAAIRWTASRFRISSAKSPPAAAAATPARRGQQR